MPNYRVKLSSLTPMLQHKALPSSEVKKMKSAPVERQVEAAVYRMVDGDDSTNLAIPGSYIRGSLIQAFVMNAGAKEKKKTALDVKPSIQIEEFRIDLGKKQEYVIDTRMIPVKKMGSIVAQDEVSRPRFDKWEAEFTLESSLSCTDKQVEIELKFAGKKVGIGAGRCEGYGRFKVDSFKRISD